MCLERKSCRILPGKCGERFDGGDESYRNPVGLITVPPAQALPGSHRSVDLVFPGWVLLLLLFPINPHQFRWLEIGHRANPV